jgi:DNA-binding NarL/FixJ family response regulator
VLDLLREGCTTAEIARRLFVSPVTVRRHVSAVLRKLDVPDRASAVDLLESQA